MLKLSKHKVNFSCVDNPLLCYYIGYVLMS